MDTTLSKGKKYMKKKKSLLIITVSRVWGTSVREQ